MLVGERKTTWITVSYNMDPINNLAEHWKYRPVVSIEVSPGGQTKLIIPPLSISGRTEGNYPSRPGVESIVRNFVGLVIQVKLQGTLGQVGRLTSNYFPWDHSCRDT